MPSLAATVVHGLGRLNAPWLDQADFARLRRLMRLGEARPMLMRGYGLRRARLGGVPVEWIEPQAGAAARTLLYLHGGGWTLGLHNGYRWMVSLLAAEAGAQAILVDYRLAPEHPFPAGLEDCLSAYRALLAEGVRPQEVMILGDSAGGNLTLASLLQLRAAGEALPAAAGLLSAALDLTLRPEWPAQTDPLLPARFALRLLEGYMVGLDPADLRLSPLLGDLAGLPPLLVQAGGAEMLLQDSVRCADKARAAGVPVQLEIFPGIGHVWHLYAPWMPEARQAVQQIAIFARRYVSPNQTTSRNTSGC